MMRHMTIPIAILMTVMLAGCAADQKAPIETLRAPAGTSATVTEAMERGNGLFAAQDFNGAKEAYDAILKTDPSLAEAHYNLALTLDHMGDKTEARKHYVQAANLAPGNKVIWNAPPLRKFDRDQDLSKKSFLDAKPQ
jgi:Tfp pilus assembly protein PilF